jgi:transcriptional regulator with XRE-family HTH domain
VIGDDPCKLLFGPYQAPACEVGGKLYCKRWKKRVEVVGFTSSLISWPCCVVNRGGFQALILCGDLVKAVKRESELAVAHHFGATLPAVGRLRKALGLPARSQRRVPEQERPHPPERDLPEELLDATQFGERLAARLRELREQSGLTQKLLGKRARLAAPRIHGIESGATTMSLLDALRLAATLDVPLAALLEQPTRARSEARGRYARTFTPEEDAMLGTMSDQEVGLRIGCSTGTARRRRIELVIPAFGYRWRDEKG